MFKPSDCSQSGWETNSHSVNKYRKTSHICSVFPFPYREEGPQGNQGETASSWKHPSSMEKENRLEGRLCGHEESRLRLCGAWRPGSPTGGGRGPT